MTRKSPQPANENPWYILMTLHGEQDREEMDIGLAAKNRKLWNAWACQNMSVEQRRDLATGIGLDQNEIDSWSKVGPLVKRLFTLEFQKRNASVQQVPDLPNAEDIVDFSGVVFEKEIDFSRMAFPTKANFVSAEFRREANFQQCHFFRRAEFSDAKFFADARFARAAFFVSAAFVLCEFEQIADFSGSIFRHDAFFSDSSFRWTANFSNVEISEAGHFASASFYGEANFSRSVFSKIADFSLCKFRGQASFSGCRFQEYFSFTGSSFEGSAYFNSAVISAGGNFEKLRFGGDLSFNGARFESDADFRYSIFSGHADFSGAEIIRHCYFEEAKFEGESHFSRIVFRNGVFFRSATFKGTVTFEKCIFESNIGSAHMLNFSGAEFGAPTSFEYAEFCYRYPRLTNTTLHNSTYFTAKPENWPALQSPLNFITLNSKPDTAFDHETAKMAAARLRHAVSRQAMPEEEHFFFRREMHHSARERPWWRAIHIHLYEQVSNFGYSILRPSFLLLMLWAMGWWFYTSVTPLEKGEAAAYSFSAMFKFFGFQRTFMPDETQELTGWMEVAAAGQTVLAFVLIFFLGLGLRTRFRLR